MPERLGSYLLERRIGAGGMADVFLATGPRGVCVVKRPHPHLCADPEFVRMFLDEAALLAQLNHPGIAQIYDLGQVGSVYYLAMEYVEGFDLMTISLEHERNGELIAPELCARIVADVAGALHYAHEAKDARGQPINLIHRDVTPHNVLLSTQGEVKLIDFGVARASSTMHRTQAGLVKGKYPYMAPEQITGQYIDHRVDVYALGLVLYELLTNCRAIAGQTEVEQIENARWGRIRPIEQLRPNTPVPLRQIVASCLLVDPEGRYPTALALRQDLERYLTYENRVAGREDLLRLFRVVAAEAGQQGSPTTVPVPGPASDVWLPSHPTDRDTPLVRGHDDAETPEAAVGFAPTSPSARTAGPPRPAPVPLMLSLDSFPGTPPRVRAATMALLATITVAAVLGLSAVSYVLLRPTSPALDAGAEEAEDSGVLARFTFPPDDAGAGAAADRPDAGVVPGEQPQSTLVEAERSTPALLRITSEPPAEVTVDRRPVGSTPTTAELTPGVHQVLLVNRVQRFRRLTTVRLAPGESRTLDVVGKQGTLRIEADPFAAITVNGEAMGSATFKELLLWEGPCTVELELADASMERPVRRKVTVQVKAGETALVHERMVP